MSKENDELVQGDGQYEALRIRQEKESKLPESQRTIFSLDLNFHSSEEKYIYMFWWKWRHWNEETQQVVLTKGELTILRWIVRSWEASMADYVIEKKEDGWDQLAKDAEAVRLFLSNIEERLLPPEEFAIRKASEPDMEHWFDEEV